MEFNMQDTVVHYDDNQEIVFLSQYDDDLGSRVFSIESTQELDFVINSLQTIRQELLEDESDSQ